MNKHRVTCEQCVLALKAIGKSATAQDVAYALHVSVRAVATALRNATRDGRVHRMYHRRIGGRKIEVAMYRFRRLKPGTRA